MMHDGALASTIFNEDRFKVYTTFIFEVKKPGIQADRPLWLLTCQQIVLGVFMQPFMARILSQFPVGVGIRLHYRKRL